LILGRSLGLGVRVRVKTFACRRASVIDLVIFELHVLHLHLGGVVGGHSWCSAISLDLVGAGGASGKALDGDILAISLLVKLDVLVKSAGSPVEGAEELRVDLVGEGVGAVVGGI